MSERMECDVVVVGAGLAGAASAFFLARQGPRRVIVVEQEREAARHSSGRNAGLLRHASGNAELDPLCDEGIAFLADPPDDFRAAIALRRSGSFLVVPPAKALAWQRPGVERVPFAMLRERIPAFVASAGAALLHSPGDGVCDSRAVVAGFLAGAAAHGARLLMGNAAARLLVEHGDPARVIGVAVGATRIGCAAVVDATGAWAGSLGGAVGAAPLLLESRRRHLRTTAADARVDPSWPWVWDEVRGFYFRPEAGGLLLCACDDVPEPAGDCPLDPAVAAAIDAKLAAALPTLAPLAERRAWAGLRTRRGDGRFVIGPDPSLLGLIVAAGFGGHGLTTAAAIGRRVAAAVDAA